MQPINNVPLAVFADGIPVILILLQVTFGFLMRRNREAFLKYHRVLGVFILLFIILDVIIFPVLSIVGVIIIPIILAQVILGFIISRSDKNKRKLLKYHRPLGISILVLAVANFVLDFFNPVAQ